MFKFTCLIGLVACVYGFPSQQQPIQDIQPITTTSVPTTLEPVSNTEATTPINPIEHIKPAFELNHRNYVGTPRAGPQRRPVIVLHKPAANFNGISVDADESLENAASEWWSNHWENRWSRNDFDQFGGGYNPYDSYGYNNGWARPQYNFYRTYWY